MNTDLFVDAHPTQCFSCIVNNCSEYKSEVIDNQLFIVGTKPKEDKKLCTFKRTDRTNILSSLLLLYEQLTDGVYGHPEKLTGADIERICKWCIAYGMPAEASGDADIWMKYGKVGFLASSFVNRLHDIYTCYLLWRKVYLHDTDIRNFYVEKNISDEQCIEFLKFHMMQLNIKLAPDFSVSPPTFFLMCDDLLEVAKAQLFFECMSTDSYSVGVCVACGAPFPKKRKNNTLCEACQKTKYQRTREIQRMLISGDQ